MRANNTLVPTAQTLARLGSRGARAAAAAQRGRWPQSGLLESAVKGPKDYPLWIAIALVAVYVGAGGAAKLAGVPYVHSSFPKLGLPAWFGYFIGLCEVLGPIGLLIRPLSGLAAVGIAIIMIGAIYYHATYTPVIQAAPAFVLGVLCVYIFFKRRADILKFQSKA